MEQGQSTMRERDYTVRSVTKVLQVIDILAEMPGGLGVTHVAGRLKIAKSSAHRLVTTLEKAGYVTHDQGTGRYRLTYKIFELGSNLLRGRGFNEHVAFLLEQLSMSTNYVVKLGVNEGGKMLCVYRVNSREVFRMDLPVGSRLPLHCTGMGKAFLATCREEELIRYLRSVSLQSYTPNTITTRDRLIKEVKQAKVQGYAIDRGEHSEDVWCVSAGVVDNLGHTISVLSISGPAADMKKRNLNQLGFDVKETSKKISVIIGYA